MKNIIAFFVIILALILPASVWSATVQKDKLITLSFDKISVVNLANFVYGDILKTNFAVHHDLVESPKLVTLHFQSDFDPDKLNAFMTDFLLGAGITIDKKRGYVFLRPTTIPKVEEQEPDVFFYRSKHRPVSYLIDITSSLFKTGRFSGQRLVKQSEPVLTNSAPPSPATPQSGGNTKQGKNSDSGTSAFSQLDKNEADSFLFQGSQKEIALLQKLLAQIDTPVAEVFVKGMVYEVTTTSKDGSAFSLALSLLSGKFGLTFGAQALQGGSLSFKNAQIDAVFSALATDTRFKSISNPSLRVKNGASARFSVGADVPVLSSVQSDKNGNPIQAVDYKPSGSIFDIRPNIRDDTIDLQISQQLSTFVLTTTGVNNSPTLIKREISTSVGAVDGDVILLGGLDEDKSITDKNGFSFLPDWAKSKGSDSSKTQILLVLQVQKL
ncbi:MAG: type II secretory pathway, component PulD [Polaromonas sp.]